MYIPASFDVSDDEVLEAFMQRYNFATLISLGPAGLVASHVPITLERTAARPTLVGHLARANGHWRSFDGNTDALVIFSGPHAYISPTWYATSPAVPTWNYTAVHVHGKPRVTQDIEATTAALSALVAKHEGTRPKPWRMQDLPQDYFSKLASAIVAFEMPVDRIEGKFKLGQNRSAEDRAGTLQGLKSEGTRNADALAEFIEACDRVSAA